jgi:hypothetical protein
MSEPIKCFMLTYVRLGTLGIYTDESGREFHLGNIPSVDQDGTTVQPAPVGAMWDCDWFAGCHESSGLKYDRHPDGMVLCVRCPDGDWLIDGPSQGGGRWERTGEAPNITVTPSILQPRYHGWLRDGYLVEV